MVVWPVPLLQVGVRKMLRERKPVKEIVEEASAAVMQCQPTEICGFEETVYALTIGIFRDPSNFYQIEAMLLVLFSNMNVSSSTNYKKFWSKAWHEWYPELFAHVVLCKALGKEPDVYYLMYGLYSLLDEADILEAPLRGFIIFMNQFSVNNKSGKVWNE